MGNYKIQQKENNYLYYRILIGALFIGVFLFYLKYTDEPLFGWYSSREAQTAISAQWFDFGHFFKSFFSYETPVFGYPWSSPFELPLYQACAAALHGITGLPLDQVGRNLSVLFYFSCFIPLYKIIKNFELNIEIFYLSTILWLLSPVYLYWSRAFLIESTALLTGFLFLWASINCYKNGGIKWIFWTGVFGILSILVKVTTFPSFVLAALFAVFPFYWAKEENFFQKTKKCIFQVIPLLGVLFICFIAVKFWTEHADNLKMQNTIASALTSKNLHGWNFGSLSQRFSAQLWRDALIARILPHAIGSAYTLLVIGVAFFLAERKEKFLLSALLVLFFTPILLFTNLHIIHDYYQYATSFWLIICLALSLFIIKEKISSILFFVLLLTIVGLMTVQFQKYFLKYVIDINAAQNNISNQDRLDVANKIRASTEKKSMIILFGEDWAPEIPFYAERKALMISGWIKGVQADKILKQETTYGGLKVSAIVINNRFISSEDKSSINVFLSAHPNLNNVIKIGDFDLLVDPHFADQTISAKQK